MKLILGVSGIFTYPNIYTDQYTLTESLSTWFDHPGNRALAHTDTESPIFISLTALPSRVPRPRP